MFLKTIFLSVIVGHNVIYDLSVISKTLKKYNIDVPKFNYICTKRLSQKYVRKQMLSLPNMGSLKLNKLVIMMHLMIASFVRNYSKI